MKQDNDRMSREEKKYISSYVWYFVWLIVAIAVVFGVFNALGKVGSTATEALIFQNSYQKVSSDRGAMKMYKAQYAEVQYQLSQDVSDETRANLNKQASALRVQMNAQ